MHSKASSNNGYNPSRRDGASKYCQSNPPTMIPITLDAQRQKRDSCRGQQPSQRPGHLQRARQMTAVRPQAQQTDQPAGEHAGEQARRGQHGAQAGRAGLPARQTKCKAQGHNREAAQADPPDGPRTQASCVLFIPGFESLCEFAQNGRGDFDGAIERSEDREESAHEIQGPQPRIERADKGRLEGEEICSAWKLLLGAEYFRAGCDENDSEDEDGREAQERIDPDSAQPATIDVLRIFVHAASVPPPFAAQITHVREIIVTRATENADVSYRFHPHWPARKLAVRGRPRW